MNQEELKQILPHREQMLLLDSAERVGDTARGVYHVRGDEWFLQGHFPGNPVVPGVIQCEILAQSVCVLLADRMSEDAVPMYTGLNNVRFKKPVLPGDTFETECQVTKVRPPFYFAKGTGSVNGQLCVRAEFSFAILPKEKARI
ncbi:MAG: beta-hydroxyacyl-ACP dehydratase [Oscillospiraceae bacterium]|nr:beta-hydroxyacyl-ACP dehydratase [Oscillospiraceae bacterium]MCD8375460.1 beta-hydroxyacyl-ACP dehydratase [Oscillospiraceae bacterium]